MTSATAQGKINLYFQVGPRLKNGYHDVLSLYQAVALTETVTVTPSSSWSVNTTSDLVDTSGAPTDQSNLVVRAALALAQQAGIKNPQPMHFEVEKQIPVAGGMAGGSADAAASLVAINEAWCLGLDFPQLMAVAASLGADVPFALMGGTAIGTGTGVKLSKQPDLDPLHLVLLLNPKPLSTAAVFERFDALGLGEKINEDLSLAELVSQLGHNSLSPAAFSLMPELKELAEKDFGFGKAWLSGSGPTLWYRCETQSAAEKAADELRALGHSAISTSTSNMGSRLV